MKNFFVWGLLGFLLGSTSFASTLRETAILSLQRGSKVSTKELMKVLKHSSVMNAREVFHKQDREYLKGIKAEHLAQSWVVEVKDQNSFFELERYIHRHALPLNLELNDLDVKIQSSTLNDPFSNLQWGLNNLGVSQNIDLDPTKTYRVPGIAGEDVQYPEVLSSHGISEKRSIIVAVMDTGIDKNHPDLKSVLVRKESECKALEKFLKCAEDGDRKECEKKWMDLKNPEVDQDKNGYPMDCEGWSLLGGTNFAKIMGRPDFTDESGHGTHVSGIIAAIANNKVGVAGITQKVKILPIQVVGVQPSEPIKPLSVDLNPSEEVIAGKNRSLGDLVARGVIYALRSGAQVINFSMGWPQARDSEFMRQVIEEAQRQGVIIVAAAGNDSTRALLRPCAYPGVICVGAHGPDGGLAHFSNYGSGVDIAAPGVNILSTSTLEKRPVRFRSTAGYDYLSGTSQASPFVAGIVGEFLAKGISREEIFPRLVLGARPLKKSQALFEGFPNNVEKVLPAEAHPYQKYLLSGLMDVKNSLKVAPQALILPSSKETVEILWDRKSAVLKTKIPLKNFWKDIASSEVQIKASFVKPDTESVRPRVTAVKFNGGAVWKSTESRDLEVEMVIDDNSDPSLSRLPSELDLHLDIAVAGQRRRVVISTEVLVTVSTNFTGADVMRLPLTGMPTGRTEFVPVDESWDSHPTKRDYLITSQQQKKWQIWLATQDGNSMNSPYRLSAPAKITVEGEDDNLRTQILARIARGPQGQLQYVLGLFEDNSGEAEAKPSPMTFYFFDPQMKLLDSFVYKSDRAQIPYQVYWQNIDGTKMPCWIGAGKKPKPKRGLKDRWENPEDIEKEELRFYYLDGKKVLNALQAYEDYKIVDIVEPTQEQKANGRVPVLLAKNAGTEAKPSYIYEFAVAEVIQGKVENFKKMDFFGSLKKYRNLLDTRVDKVNSLDPSNEQFRGSFWFSEGQRRQQRISLFDQKNFEFIDQELAALNGLYDSALWVRAAFYGKNRKGAFVLTNSEIQYHDLVNEKATSRSMDRYTFFPDNFMTNAYFPLVLKDNRVGSSHIPALFTTEASELNRGVKMVVPFFASDGRVIELVSPARLRFKTNAGCRPVSTPVFLGEKAYAFDYYCGSEIIRIPLSY